MKHCKIVHVHDASPIELADSDRHHAEEYIWAEEFLSSYLKEGYEVRQIIPDITPAINEKGNFTFYKGGFVVYLEKDD